MKKAVISIIVVAFTALLLSGCSSLNKTRKGVAVGVVVGGAIGAVIGKAAGNIAMGATAGGVTGAVIGHQMVKQAEEILKTVPDAKVERVGEVFVVEFSNNVLFGFDKANLSEDAKLNLNKLYTVLVTYPETNIEVQGHTDSKGSDTYNSKLSVRRAASVSDYLRLRGIPTDRLSINGFGERVPKYNYNTADGQTQNRRVEFLITANEKKKADAGKIAGK